MINHGLWILMIITFNTAGDIELVPYAIYDSWAVFNAWKDTEELEFTGKVSGQFTCTMEADA